MEGEQRIIPSSSKEEPDYADSLEPGYCFCPTDYDLIVHYLKKKIQTGNHPKCRLHEVNIYDHHPQELSERYLSHENKWYFLTSRDRKYPKGDLPNRKTKNFGSWKASQRYTTVYNNAREAVGSKRSLAYYDDKGKKTSWLMHEYTTNDPNLPIGSDGNKLSDCVLCEVYKKAPVMILNDNNKRSRQIQNRRNQEQNQLDDEPSTRRRKVSTCNSSTGPEHFPNSTRDVEIATPVRSLSTSYQQSLNNIDGCDQPFPPQTLPQLVYNIDACDQPFPPQTLPLPVNNIDGCRQSFPPQTLIQPVNNIRGCDQPFPPQTLPQPVNNIDACDQPFPPQTLPQPVNNIDRRGQPFPPKTLPQHVDKIMHTRIKPNLRRSGTEVEAFAQKFSREQVGPYSDNGGGGNTMGTDPYTPTSADSLDDPTDPMTWVNNFFEDLPPWFLTEFLHEDPTLVILPDSTNEDPSSETRPYYGLDQDIGVS